MKKNSTRATHEQIIKKKEFFHNKLKRQDDRILHSFVNVQEGVRLKPQLIDELSEIEKNCGY